MTSIAIPPDLAADVAARPEAYRPYPTGWPRADVVEVLLLDRANAGTWGPVGGWFTDDDGVPVSVALRSDGNRAPGADAWALVGSVDGGARPDVGDRVLVLECAPGACRSGNHTGRIARVVSGGDTLPDLDVFDHRGNWEDSCLPHRWAILPPAPDTDAPRPRRWLVSRPWRIGGSWGNTAGDMVTLVEEGTGQPDQLGRRVGDRLIGSIPRADAERAIAAVNGDSGQLAATLALRTTQLADEQDAHHAAVGEAARLRGDLASARAEVVRLGELVEVALDVRHELKVNPPWGDVASHVAGLVAGVAAQRAALARYRRALQRTLDTIPDLCGCGEDYCVEDRTKFHAAVADARAALADAELDEPEPLVTDVKLDPDGPL